MVPASTRYATWCKIGTIPKSNYVKGKVLARGVASPLTTAIAIAAEKLDLGFGLGLVNWSSPPAPSLSRTARLTHVPYHVSTAD